MQGNLTWRTSGHADWKTDEKMASVRRIIQIRGDHNATHISSSVTEEESAIGRQHGTGSRAGQHGEKTDLEISLMTRKIWGKQNDAHLGQFSDTSRCGEILDCTYR